MDNLERAAKDLFEYDSIYREAKQKRDEQRKKLFNIFFNKVEEPPIIQVELEKAFFTRIEITEAEYLKTRYPSWNLLERNEKDDCVVFTLKKNKEYLPNTYFSEDLKVTFRKQVSEYDPKVDWDSLLRDDPELFYLIVKENVTYELDGAALDVVIAEQPEKLAVLERHLIMHDPVVKLSLRKENAEDDDG